MIRTGSLATARAVAALLLSLLCLTLGASLAKQLFPSIGPEGTAAVRLVLAAVLLAPVLRPWRLLRTQGLNVLLLYGAALAGMNLLFYMAIARIPLGIAIAIEFAGPLSLAALCSRRRLDYAWIVIAIAGLWLLLPAGGLSSPLDRRGVACALGAGACWALYMAAGKATGRRHGTAATAAGLVIAALLVAPAGVASAGWGLLEPRILILGLGVALLSSALAYSLEMVALRQLSHSSFGTLLSVQPAIGALVGWVLLGEGLTPVQWAAIGLVMAASIGAAAGAAQAARRPEPAATS